MNRQVTYGYFSNVLTSPSLPLFPSPPNRSQILFLDLVAGPNSNKMAAIHALAAYGEDSDSEGNQSAEEEITPEHTAHLNSDVSISQLQSKFQLKSAPEVTAKVC